MKKSYKIVTTFAEIENVIKWCQETRYCSFDYETRAHGPLGPSYKGKNSDNPAGPQFKEDKPTILGISFQIGFAYVIPLFHLESPFSNREVLKIFTMLSQGIFENKEIIKIAHNFKFEYKWSTRYGCKFNGRIFDTMLAKYLLDEERPHGLKDLVALKFPEYAEYDDEVEECVKKGGGWHSVPLDTLSEYCALDCDMTLRLMIILEEKLMDMGFYLLFRNMTMMQTRVLAESEIQGFIIDKDYLYDLEEKEAKKIEETEEALQGHKKIRKFLKQRKKDHIKKLIENTQDEIRKIRSGEIEYANIDRAIQNREEKVSRYLAGELVTNKEKIEDRVNFNSTPQLRELLFTSKAGFKFGIVKYTLDKKKQPTENPSTDEDVLLELELKDKSGFISNLLKLRGLNKIYSTYIKGPMKRINHKGRLNTDYLIHGTVTGRLSSKNPNLQNIPRGTTSNIIKRMFIPPKDHLILEVDYGQAELRVVAEISNDKTMIELFDKGYNIHVATACKANDCIEDYDHIKKVVLKDENHPDNLFWTKQKKRAKVINFGIIYGQTPKMLAESLSLPGDPVTEEEARQFREEWLNLYPGVKRWFKKQERFLKKHGYVKNIFGRKRRLPGIWDSQIGVQNKAIRDCINAPIQGASSDMTQFSSVVIREQVIKNEIIMSDYAEFRNQLYTVHDSLGFYIQPKYIHTVVPQLKAICENPQTQKYFGFQMKKVRMKVSAEIGLNWGELKDYNKEEDYQKWIS
jgi:DNA polymerase I-like protein with 3'-5' exonuclease and polymerase domains